MPESVKLHDVDLVGRVDQQRGAAQGTGLDGNTSTLGGPCASASQNGQVFGGESGHQCSSLHCRHPSVQCTARQIMHRLAITHS
jgi:hypothetical protein